MIVARPSRTTRWTVQLPKAWPPASAATLMQRITRTFRELRGVTYEERLASSPKVVINTRWRLEPPDKLAYQMHGGAAGIQIGARRWDRAGSASWVPSDASRLPQPTPLWQNVTDAHSPRTHDRPRTCADVVASSTPRRPPGSGPRIDVKTDRLLDLHMVAPAHFMHDVYGPFNGPAADRAADEARRGPGRRPRPRTWWS